MRVFGQRGVVGFLVRRSDYGSSHVVEVVRERGKEESDGVQKTVETGNSLIERQPTRVLAHVE